MSDRPGLCRLSPKADTWGCQTSKSAREIPHDTRARWKVICCFSEIPFIWAPIAQASESRVPGAQPHIPEAGSFPKHQALGGLRDADILPGRPSRPQPPGGSSTQRPSSSAGGALTRFPGHPVTQQTLAEPMGTGLWGQGCGLAQRESRGLRRGSHSLVPKPGCSPETLPELDRGSPPPSPALAPACREWAMPPVTS